MIHSRGALLLMLDADGATKIDDLEKLENQVGDLFFFIGSLYKFTLFVYYLLEISPNGFQVRFLQLLERNASLEILLLVIRH